MPPADSVRSWLATYKSLPKENLVAFAYQILSDSDLIKEIFYILNDPRHHDFDPVYHQLYELCRSSNSKLRIFCLQYIPTFIYIYLKEHSRLKGLDYDIFAKLESFLLALYNSAFAQNVIKYFPPEGVSRERFYPLNYPSIYHDPQFYALNTLMEHSHLFMDPSGSLISGGPMISYDEGADLEPIMSVNSENRLKLVTALLFIHNQCIAEIPKCALKLTCMVVVNLCLSSFGDHLASYSIPASYNSSNFPLAGRNKFRDSVARYGNVTENRIPADEHLYREFLHTIYYAIYNGVSEEGLEALDAIHMRSTYQLYPEVLLLVGAIKNSVNKATLKDAKSSTMGIWLSSVPPSAIAALSKSAITNASFKLRKLPDDISPIVTTTLQSVREEDVHTPSPSFTSPPTQYLGDKKQMSKAAIAANRLKEVLLHPTSNTSTTTTIGNKGTPAPHEMIPMTTLLAADALEHHGSGSATITGGEVDRHVRYPYKEDNETTAPHHDLGHLFASHESTGAGQVQPSHHAFSFLPAGAAKFWTKALALGLENQNKLGITAAAVPAANLEPGPVSDLSAIANVSRDITPPAYAETPASVPSSSKDRIKHKLDKVRARLKEFQQHLEEPVVEREEPNRAHKDELGPETTFETFNQGADLKPDLKVAVAGPTKKTKTLKKQMAAHIGPAFAASLKKAQTDPTSQNGVGARRKSSGPGIEPAAIPRDFEESVAEPDQLHHYPNLKPSLPPLSREASRTPADFIEDKASDLPLGGTKSGAHHLVKFGKADVLGKRAKLQPHKKGLKEEFAALKINLKKAHTHQFNSKSALDLSPPLPKQLHSALKNTRPDPMTFAENLPTDQPTIKPIISDDEASSGPEDQGLNLGIDKMAGTESSGSQREPLAPDRDKERLKGTEKIKQFIDNAIGAVDKERKVSDGRGSKAAPSLHHVPSLDEGATSTHYNKKRRKTGLPSKKKILAEILGGLHQGTSQSSSSSEGEKHPKLNNKKQLNVKREKMGKGMVKAEKGGAMAGTTLTSSSPDLINPEEGFALENLAKDPTQLDNTQGPDDEGSYISDRFNRLQQLQKYQERTHKPDAKKGAGHKVKKYYVKKKKSLPITMLADHQNTHTVDGPNPMLDRDLDRRLSDPASVTDFDCKQHNAVIDSEKMQQLAGKIKKFLTVSSTSSSPGPPHRKDNSKATSTAVRSDTSDNTPNHRENTNI